MFSSLVSQLAERSREPKERKLPITPIPTLAPTKIVGKTAPATAPAPAPEPAPSKKEKKKTDERPPELLMLVQGKPTVADVEEYLRNRIQTLAHS